MLMILVINLYVYNFSLKYYYIISKIILLISPHSTAICLSFLCAYLMCLDLDNHHCQAAEQISYYHILRCVNTSVVLGPGDLLLSGDGLALPTVNPVTVTAVKPGETDEKRMPTTFTGNFILYFYNLVDIPGCYQLSYPDD